MSISDRIVKLWTEDTGLDPGKVSSATPLRNWSEHFDSLDLAEFFMAVEEEFNLEIPDRLCAGFDTLGDVIAHVESLSVQP